MSGSVRSLDVMVDVPRRDDEIEGRDGTPVGRRAFLGAVALGTAGVFFGGGLQRRFARVTGPVVAADPTGLTSLIPGVGKFRIYTVTGDLPTRSTEEWSLRVDGLVDEALDLTYAELLAMEPTSITADFQCVTGWRVDDVQWKGVRLADVLARAGVGPGATHLRFESFDGTYTESLTLDQARRDDFLVAYEMLGAGVERRHGGPVRMYVAPMYGYKSIKWLERIEVVDELVPGYWEERGYDIDAWVGESNGRRDAPTPVSGS